ncbi:MAG: hypothetical protein ABW094_15900 [Candidatus Thiodiazotropha sp.]
MKFPGTVIHQGKKQNQAWLWNRVEALLTIAYSTQVNERYYFTDKELYSVGMAL